MIVWSVKGSFDARARNKDESLKEPTIMQKNLSLGTCTLGIVLSSDDQTTKFSFKTTLVS